MKVFNFSELLGPVIWLELEKAVKQLPQLLDHLPRNRGVVVPAARARLKSASISAYFGGKRKTQPL